MSKRLVTTLLIGAAFVVMSGFATSPATPTTAAIGAPPAAPAVSKIGALRAAPAEPGIGAPPAAAPAAPAIAPNQGTIWKDADGNPLPFANDEELMEFMRTATIESEADIELGITNPRQVVLERDGIKMRAALRDYDETFERRTIDGVFYARLRDSYEFDVPAYALAGLLGFDNIPPVVIRRIGSANVSLQVWLEGGLMESDRIVQGIEPPSYKDFRQQTQNMRVFDVIVGNVDRNTGNILIDADWKFWLIDHSRSFMRNDETKYLERVEACGRGLYERIQALTEDSLQNAMSPPLTASEVTWVMARREKLMDRINTLIAERGEGAVLFDEDA